MVLIEPVKCCLIAIELISMCRHITSDLVVSEVSG